jgi:hypothetical protein
LKGCIVLKGVAVVSREMTAWQDVEVIGWHNHRRGGGNDE